MAVFRTKRSTRCRFAACGIETVPACPFSSFYYPQHWPLRRLRRRCPAGRRREKTGLALLQLAKSGFNLGEAAINRLICIRQRLRERPRRQFLFDIVAKAGDIVRDVPESGDLAFVEHIPCVCHAASKFGRKAASGSVIPAEGVSAAQRPVTLAAWRTNRRP